jgi:hypothetical protein
MGIFLVVFGVLCLIVSALVAASPFPELDDCKGRRGYVFDAVGNRIPVCTEESPGAKPDFLFSDSLEEPLLQ